MSLGLVCIVSFGSTGLYTKAFRALFAWRFIGLLIVPYLMIVEFAMLKTICVYCTTMHLALLVDFGMVTYFFFHKKDVKSSATSQQSLGTSLPQVGPEWFLATGGAGARVAGVSPSSESTSSAPRENLP